MADNGGSGAVGILGVIIGALIVAAIGYFVFVKDANGPSSVTLNVPAIPAPSVPAPAK